MFSRCLLDYFNNLLFPFLWPCLLHPFISPSNHRGIYKTKNLIMLLFCLKFFYGFLRIKSKFVYMVYKPFTTGQHSSLPITILISFNPASHTLCSSHIGYLQWLTVGFWPVHNNSVAVVPADFYPLRMLRTHLRCYPSQKHSLIESGAPCLYFCITQCLLLYLSHHTVIVW